MAQQTALPIQYIRQYAGPIDADEVFETTSARNAYLTNPRRYGGMTVSDLEDGEVYVLNAARTAWRQLATSSAINVVVAKTTNYNVVVGDNNTFFTNQGTAGLVNFNLPTAQVGLIYTFIVQNINGLKVTAAAGDTIRLGLNITSAAGNIQATDIGSKIVLLAINATEWIALNDDINWVLSS